MNKNVLITGASSGIGSALAKEFAKRGDCLFLTGRNEEALKRIQEEISKKSKVKVWIMVLDLQEEGAEERLYTETKKVCKSIDVLVNNAGFGYVGEFLACQRNCMEGMIAVNISVLTKLIMLYAADMKEQGSGEILNVASTGAYHPGPYTAVYYATKAYVLSLSEALSEELKPYNITVSAVCPGATRTQFSKRAGRKENKLAMSPEYVAKKAVGGLERKKRVIIPKFMYKCLVKIPRNIAAFFIGRQQKKLRYDIDN